MSLPIVMLLIAACALIYFLWRRQRFGGSAERDLLQLCLGDRGQMKRLIELERRKAPSLTRLAAIEQAIYALRRDHR
jgi:hypothetical protein